MRAAEGEAAEEAIEQPGVSNLSDPSFLSINAPTITLFERGPTRPNTGRSRGGLKGLQHFVLVAYFSKKKKKSNGDSTLNLSRHCLVFELIVLMIKAKTTLKMVTIDRLIEVARMGNTAKLKYWPPS